ncbi:MAG: hypothetical protein AAFR25_04195 [Cyanobacteria bacterium J06629_19]
MTGQLQPAYLLHKRSAIDYAQGSVLDCIRELSVVVGKASTQ